MTNKSKKTYLPHERNYLEQDPQEFRAYSKNHKSYSTLPDPVQDPIVANNISCPEFDYTESSQISSKKEE